MKTIITKGFYLCCLFIFPLFLNAQHLSPAQLLTPSNGATNQPSTITLKWRAVPGANQYKVSVSTLNHSNDVFWDSTYTDTVKVLTGLTNGTYVWRIKAKQTSPYDTSSWTLPAWTFVVGSTNTGSGGNGGGVTSLTAPVLISPSKNTSLQVLGTTLVWQAVSGATYYKVNVATDAAMSNIVFTDNNVTTTSRVAQNLTFNTTYYWTVQAANATSTGPLSNVNNFRTMPDNPNAVTGHPRLLINQNDVNRLRTWASSNNPMFVSLQNALGYAIGVYNSQFFPNGQANPNWPDNGSTTWTGYVTESYAELFAFWSLIDPNVANRPLHAKRARNLLMYVINQAAQGHAADVPFRDPQFMCYDRSRVYGEACGLTVDWIYNAVDANNNPILTAADKAQIQKVFLMWCNDQLSAYNHPTPIGLMNDPQITLTNRWVLNNYYSGHARNLTMMSLALDAADDVPVNQSLHYSALGNSVRSYLFNVTGAWLYQQYAQYEYPSVVSATYGVSSAGLGMGSGGLSTESSLYGQSIGWVAQQLLALKTAGWTDENVIGKQARLFSNGYWTRLMDGILHTMVPTPKVFPQKPYLGSIYQGANYGDLLRSWITPEFIDVAAPIGLTEMNLGNNSTLLNKTRWFVQNGLEGGSALMAQRASNIGGNSYITASLYYFMLFDPANGNTIPDPRPSIATTFNDQSFNRVLSRTDWSTNATMFDWHCHWTSINHQSGDGNQFELFRKGEWLIKERSGYTNDGVGYTSEFHNTLGLQNDVPAGGIQWFEGETMKRGGQWTNGLSSGDPKVTTSVGSNYVYATGDATNLYNRTSSATDIVYAVRSIVWLKPDHIVVYDRAKSKTANRFKRFYLQFTAPPSVSGKDITVNTPGGQKVYMSNLLPANGVVTAFQSEMLNSLADLEPTTHEVKIEDPSNPTDVRFLNVLQGADGTATKDAVTLVQSTAGTPFEGTIVKNTAVMFPNVWNSTVTTTTYTVPTTVAQHIITGLTPYGTYALSGITQGSNIVVTLTLGGSLVADAGGVLVANAGSFPTSSIAPIVANGHSPVFEEKKGAELYQNAPNPFDNNTSISYKLGEKTTVTLRITDLLGREIAVPVNAVVQDAGYYQVNFQTNNLPAGIYHYELRAGDTRLARRMIVK